MQIQPASKCTLQPTPDSLYLNFALHPHLSREYSPDEQDLLSQQFSRLPYKFYKCWLILSPIIIITAELTIKELKLPIPNPEESDPNIQFGQYEVFIMGYAMRILNLCLLVIGSGEMLFAISKRKSKMAQRGGLKFRYSLMALLVGSIIVFLQDCAERAGHSLRKTLIYLALNSIPVIQIVGSFAVVRVFKRNHPLKKQHSKQIEEGDEDEEDSITKEFMEQNAAVASEILKCDRKLKKCQYLAYRWWLQFVVILETARVIQYFLYIIMLINEGFLVLLPEFSAVFCSFFLSAWSGLEMEISITIKSVARSKRAVILSNICIIGSTITCVTFAGDGSLNLASTDSRPLEYLFSFMYCGLIPIFTLIGALKVKKILEQREKLTNVSSFTNESYL